MPLDPEVKSWLDEMLSGTFTPIEQMTPEQARRQMLTACQNLAPGPELASVKNMTTTGSHGSIPVRVFRPDENNKLPVIVYFHGGGWVVGGIDTHDIYCRELATHSNAVVVSVDYRLAPEYRFPTAFEDCYSATSWVSENAEQLNIDPNRIAVAGDSAGGNLAATVAMGCT